MNTLPEVSPPPGSTPEGVTVNAVWEAVLALARITFGASPSANIPIST